MIVVLPSPLLGPTAYAPLVGALDATGHPARLAPTDATSGVDAVLDAWRGATSTADAVVAHSNAGYLAPLVRGARDLPVVFVDAALPADSGPGSLAPQRLRERLDALAEGRDILPPWTRWWDRETTASVIPPALLDVIDRECPAVPLAWFDAEVTPPEGWLAGPNAYLAFGGTYAVELALATAAGWPVAELDGGHLHHLWDPSGVAATVLALLDGLAQRSSR